MNPKLVWIVEDKDGNIRSNWSTGTRIYTRKHNAEQACKKVNGYGSHYKVVEYALIISNKEHEGDE